MFLIHVYYIWLSHLGTGVLKMHGVYQREELENLQRISKENHQKRDEYSLDHSNNVTRDEGEGNDYQPFDDVEQGEFKEEGNKN